MPDPTPASGELVRVDDPANMNLLGLLMRNLLASNMARRWPRMLAKGLRGDVAVSAGTMAVTLRFGDGVCTVVRGPSGGPRARVQGTMPALLDIVLRRRMIRAFLLGRIRIGGNLLFLLRMFPLIGEPKGGAA